jgi:hypothetical protein
MPDDRDLSRRLTATLTAYAAAAPVATDDAPFDPTRRMSGVRADVGAIGANGSGPRRPTRLLLAAAVLALVGTAVLVVPRQGDGKKEGGDVTTERHALPGPPTAPDDALAATWAPDGWDLTSVGWNPSSSEEQDDDEVYTAWPEPGDRAQLFADPELPAFQVLVESGGDIAAQEPNTATEVRGRPAMEMPDGPSPPAFGGGDVDTVWWSEGGVDLRATFALSAWSEALQFLSSLEPRSGGPAAGFDTGPGSRLTLTGESTSSASSQTWTSTAHSFATAEGEEYGLSIDVVSPSGMITTDYVISQLYGEPAADGTVTHWDESESTLIVAHPDGMVVRAQAYRLYLGTRVGVVAGIPGLGTPRPVVEEALASVEPVTPQVLQGWWDDVDDARAAAPLVARVDLPSAELEVRRAGEHVFLCQVVDDDRACVDTGPGTGEMYETRMTIGNQEVAVAVNRGGEVRFEATYEGGSDVPTPLEAEVAHDGDWWVSLASYDDEIEELGWSFPNGIVVDDPTTSTAPDDG